MIALIDYGVGNLSSVAKAFEHVAAPVRVIRAPGELAGARAIVLPGVGAFGDAAAHLRRAGFEDPVRAAVADGIPLLGICVGLQLLFDESEEMGRHHGLGLFPGVVRRFADGMTVPARPAVTAGPAEAARPAQAAQRLKVPQIGWNQVHHPASHPLLAGVPSGSYAYFVHSYYCAPADPDLILATTDYGIDYASICGRGRVVGIQFHPEKSQAVGLRILRNFVNMVEDGL